MTTLAAAHKRKGWIIHGGGGYFYVHLPVPLAGFHRSSDYDLLCTTRTVEHNYILPSSTVGIQLHVSALYVGHLQVVMLLTE